VAKPRATVLYDYSAGDTDEISLFQGEIIEINQEGLTKHCSKISLNMILMFN
jgi:hypothetical protein